MNRLVKETALRLQIGSAFAVPPTIYDVDPGWLDTDGGAGLEDRRAPYGSPEHIGERMGEAGRRLSRNHGKRRRRRPPDTLHRRERNRRKDRADAGGW
ncbi:hypothetical protein PENNAL_c0032G02970 [Penicillium nalgiovense]|uniref:Uncharacterized protein n=1 Tax=Penicillium nalgiovense TaxID=60175 RepID=A0A1V6Y7N1_PENNA|nr:hypothetical protein PENNAL_c0032G02970 [Penicillium nalgiovense]